MGSDSLTFGVSYSIGRTRFFVWTFDSIHEMRIDSNITTSHVNFHRKTLLVSLNEANTVDSPLIRLLIGVAVHQKTLFNAIAILKNFENIFEE